MSRSVSAPSSVTKTSPCWNGLIVPGSTFRYGSNFWSWTRSPRALSRRPSDAATIPFPSAETTPPVTKTYFGARALTGFQGSSVIGGTPLRGGGVRAPRAGRLAHAFRRVSLRSVHRWCAAPAHVGRGDAQASSLVDPALKCLGVRRRLNELVESRERIARERAPDREERRVDDERSRRPVILGLLQVELGVDALRDDLKCDPAHRDDLEHEQRPGGVGLVQERRLVRPEHL